jgi:hypothetical protein
MAGILPNMIWRGTLSKLFLLVNRKASSDTADARGGLAA